MSNELKDSKSYQTLSQNISRIEKIIKILKTSFGPYSMNKIITRKNGKDVITSDGATIVSNTISEDSIEKILVEMVKSQDYEEGDGTTSVCLLTYEILIESFKLIQQGFDTKDILKNLKKCGLLCQKILNEIAEDNKIKNFCSLRQFLLFCSSTSLKSKSISSKRHIFSNILVDIVLSMGNKFNKNSIIIQEIIGGSSVDSFFFNGICFKKPFSYAGYEKQKKKYFNGNLLLLNFELELSAEKFECEFKIKNVSFFRKFIDSEWSIFYEKLDSIVFSGCIVVFSSQSIGDLATQYFSERNMLCGGRIDITILEKISNITKTNVIPSVYEISKNSMGFFRIVEEKQISSEKYIFINSYISNILTLVIRGGNDNLIKDTIRSVNDGLMVIKHIYHSNKFVGGAGSCEMKLSEKLRKYAKTLAGTDQYIVSKLSKVFEIIPKTLIENSGIDPLEIMAKLRKLNSSSEKWYGVELSKGNIIDSLANFIWEPLSMKMNIIKTALGTCDLIINTDNTIV